MSSPEFSEEFSAGRVSGAKARREEGRRGDMVTRQDAERQRERDVSIVNFAFPHILKLRCEDAACNQAESSQFSERSWLLRKNEQPRHLTGS